jgi:hypothetical protein
VVAAPLNPPAAAVPVVAFPFVPAVMLHPISNGASAATAINAMYL